MNGQSIRRHKIIPTVSSATMLAAAFWWPAAFFWCVFLFLIPIFYHAFTQPQSLTYADGFVWGLLFWSLHWYALFLLVIERGQGSLRVGCVFLLTMYCAFFSGGWFWIAQKGTTYWRRAPLWVASVWIFSTFLYFSWMRHGLLLPFGLDGYCFANPLLPLVWHCWLVSWVAAISSDGLLCILLCLQAALAFVIVHKNMKALIVVIIFAIPFFGIWVSEQSAVPEIAQHIGYVRPPDEEHPMDQGQAINEALEIVLRKNRSVKIIVMPESSFPLPLNQCNAIVDLWQSNALSAGDCLVIGCHRNTSEGSYNCCYCIGNTLVTHLYDKKKLMPFTEYIPTPWNKLSLFATLFIRHKTHKILRGNTSAQPQSIYANVAVEIRICSELFFDVSTLKGSQQIPIICLVNDSWFSAGYMRTLMLLFAKMAAIEYQRHLVYVSHYVGVWLTPDGNEFFLAT
jgi:apolipoprotein N-acyltransferase